MITFINPWAFIWLFLAIPIVLLYVIRARKYTHPTAAGDIWRESISFLDPRFWWRPWRRIVSLTVQLAILLAFVVAMAEPCVRPPQRMVVIIDCTESMADALNSPDADNASEVSQKLQMMVENLGYHDRIALIAAESPARILCRTTSDRNKVLDALKEFFKHPQISDNADAVAQTLEVARALVARKAGEKLDPRTQNIILISDGCFPNFKTIVEDPCVHWLPVGKPKDNFALTQIGVRRDPIKGDPVVLTKFVNFSSQPQKGTLKVKTNVPEEGFSTEVMAKKGQTVLKNVVLSSDTGRETNIEVQWLPEKAGAGRTVKIPIPPFTAFQVYVVGESGKSGEIHALLSRVPGTAEVKSIAKNEDLPNPLPENALVIYLADTPETLPENVPAIVFAPSRSSNLWTSSPLETTQKSIIESVSPKLPLFWKEVDLIGQTFETNVEITPAVECEPFIFDAAGKPMAWKFTSKVSESAVPETQAIQGKQGTQAIQVTRVVFNCDLSHSDWPVKKDFGTFLGNVIHSFQPEGSETIVLRKYDDENRILPVAEVQPYSIPGEDIIPLWTILGLILLASVCVEWCLYQRRWLE